MYILKGSLAYIDNKDVMETGSFEPNPGANLKRVATVTPTASCNHFCVIKEVLGGCLCYEHCS